MGIEMVLKIVGLIMESQSNKTRKISELAIEKQPLIEIDFSGFKKGQFNNKLVIKNIGQSPAYSISISDIFIDDNKFAFDPNKDTNESLSPTDSRDIWVHHFSTLSNSSNINSLDVLSRMIYFSQSYNKSIRIFLKYYDRDGNELKRNFYLKVGGGDVGVQYLYTTTSNELYY